MKKNSIKALFLLLTLFAILLSTSTVAFAAEEADVDDPLRIAGCNLSFENEVHLMYAIKSDNPNVRLLVWEEAQTEYLVGTEKAKLAPQSEQMEIEGDMYTIFKYTGLSAKQMTDNVYVRAYVDGTEEYGAPHKYSVLQYVYNKLGKTGTASTNESFKNMLTEMLEYGAATQLYQAYKTDTLATDNFVQINLDGGILPGGFDRGLYKIGSSITITAPESNAGGAGFAEWVDEKGNTVADTAAAEITVGEETTTYYAIYGTTSYSEGLAFALNDDGESYSVTGIGTCTDTDLRIPPIYDNKPVTTIGALAFRFCNNLEKITIPEGIITIGQGAIAYCTNLKEIIVPSSVISIGIAALSCGNIEKIIVSENNKAYHMDGDCLIETATKILIKGMGTSIIPADGSVTTIGHSAFSNCGKLLSIEIPEGVTRIEISAFFACQKLESVIIADSVVSIGSGAFDSCSGVIEVVNGISYVDKWVVDCKTSVVTANLRSDTKGIADNSFYDCSNLTSINIPDGIKCIGRMTFDGCSNLASVNIPDGVTNIGDYAFWGCKSITSITIPEGVTKIGKDAFAGCSKLENIIIPNSVIEIGDYAFSNCNELKYNSYDNAYYLGNDKNPYVVLVKAKASYIYSCEINENTKVIYGLAFYGCSSLTSINIPASVTHIGIKGDSIVGHATFSGCSNLKSITVSSGNKVYHSDGNCLIETDSKTLIAGCQNSIIPADGSVTSIEYGVFAYCSKLENIVIPSSIESIAEYALYSCTLLEIIMYNGIIEEWLSISKGNCWDDETSNYTIYCTNGTISKDGTVTYY